jgi:two-component system NtrC family sensor kinase
MQSALGLDPASFPRPGVPHRPRLPQGFRLLWLAAVLVPALGVLGAGVMAWVDVRRDAAARLDRTVEMLRQHALRSFGAQEAILTATSHATARMGWEEMRQDPALHSLLAELVQSLHPLVQAVIVADGLGRVVLASWEFPARPTDIADRDFAVALREGEREAVGEVIVARPMGWTIFPVARLTTPRPGGDETGLVAAAFNPDPLAAFYASVVETARDTVLMMRLDGAVLARHPPLRDPAAEHGQRPARQARLAEALARPAGEAPSPSASVGDGLPRLFVARQVGDWPVAVAYGLSMEALNAAWRQRMVVPAVGGVAAAGLLLALTGLAIRGARLQQLAAERRMEAETQLARAGRAAAIGLLTAGLAHDVKNLVQAVRSGARLMDRRADDPAEVRRCAALLGDAAERGRRLVEAMLDFARGGGGDAEGAQPPLEAGQALSDLAELLNRTLGSGWRVKIVVPPGLPPARGDRAGFEAAVVNLAANARDAMPRGGTVTIAAWVEELMETREEAGLKAGRYIVAAVSDTGAGMDPATLARVGEPFFTTKGPGRGTGLGLATVRGFCTKSGGALLLDSEPGRGTTAAMWLPVA